MTINFSHLFFVLNYAVKHFIYQVKVYETPRYQVHVMNTLKIPFYTRKTRV